MDIKKFNESELLDIFSSVRLIMPESFGKNEILTKIKKHMELLEDEKIMQELHSMENIPENWEKDLAYTSDLYWSKINKE